MIEDSCYQKNLLDDLLKDKPHLEKILTYAVESIDESRASYAIKACFVCDGYNYNCPDYKITK